MLWNLIMINILITTIRFRFEKVIPAIFISFIIFFNLLYLFAKIVTYFIILFAKIKIVLIVLFILFVS